MTAGKFSRRGVLPVAGMALLPAVAADNPFPSPRGGPLPPIGSVIAYAGDVDPDLEERQGQCWLLCDGRPLKKEQFPTLFRHIGTSHGEGCDPQTGSKREGCDFNLPDYRGLFLRGLDQCRGMDPDSRRRGSALQGDRSSGNSGDKVGSLQQDALQGHTHSEAGNGHSHSGTTNLDGGHNHPVDINRQSICGNNGTHDVDNGDRKWNADPNLGTITASIPVDTGKHQHELNTRPTAVSLGDPVASGSGSPRLSRETRPCNAAVNFLIRAR
jgi:hypothetical protein